MVTAMSFLFQSLRSAALSVTGFLLAGSVWCAPAGAAAPAALTGPLPDVEVHLLSTSRDVRLAASLAGKPAVVLVTDGTGALDCPAAQAAAELQRDYAPWFSWAAVLSGPLSTEDLQRIRASSPLRLERLYLDRPGALRAAVGGADLPLLLLVDAEGAIRLACRPGEGAAGLAEAAKTLHALAAGARRRGAGVADFRLPAVGAPGLVSFLDAAGREGTLVAFLSSRCLACARELEVLDFARDRKAGRVRFVAVFIDPATDSRIRGFLAAAGATPDFVLRDPDFRLAGRYGIRTAPALLVIDGDGGIVLSRTGYREGDRDLLYQELVRAFEETSAQAEAGSLVGEARRIDEEACAFLREGKPEYALLYQERVREMLPGYPSVNLRVAEAALAAGRRDEAVRSFARYLAAEPQAYGSAEVRQRIAGLLVPAP
jgi:thiol-disulfide isomerase/thioredoxin